MRTLLIAAWSLVAPIASTQTRTEMEFFEKEIRPLLAARCHACHGGGNHLGGLALDSREGLSRGSASGPVVVPGNPAESRLTRAVRGELPARMPPGAPLGAAEIQALERWVELGAPWPVEAAPAAAKGFDLQARKREHWAWQPVRAVDPPRAGGAGAPVHPVDAFLLAELARQGLKPAAPADRRTLIRRLAFDLTGLPPTPEAIREFERDPSPDAYPKLVDRLLGSPRFGERWARHWMDLVRYSESHGSEGDPDTPMAWRYRDYLIRAFNADVPYDQFVREQIAGDLLRAPRLGGPERVNESLLGTANLRMVEHGYQPVDPWEDRIKWTDNQIDVFAKTFQGLTVSCARCHDHKFDAISQEDYYALFSVFAGARPIQVAVDVPEDAGRNRAELARLKGEIRARVATLWRGQVGALGTRLAALHGGLDGPFAPWFALAELRGDAFREGWAALSRRAADEAAYRAEFNRAHFPRIWDLRTQYSNWLGIGAGRPAPPSPPGEFQVLPSGPEVLSGIYPGGVYSHTLSTKHNAVVASPRFRITTDAVSLRMLGGNFSFAQLIVENYAVPRGGIYLMRASPKGDAMGWVRWDTSFWKGFTGYIEFATLDDVTFFALDAEDGMKKPKPEPARDGRSYFGAQLVTFHDGKERPRDELVPGALVLDGKPPRDAAELMRRYQGHLRGAIDAWDGGRATEAQAALLDYCVRRGLLTAPLDGSPELADRVAAYRRLEEQIPVPRRAPGVLEEGAADQPLLVRGNPKNPGRPVAPRYLAALGGPAYKERRTARLQLAEQVASPDNPLTARVMVNRIWALLFGGGLVKTVDNFGKLGERPSHPELLDWLARRFVEEGWSIKKTIRLLVTTRAYQMRSTPAPEAVRVDPANRLLSHMPVRRLEAEAIRDAILAVSGELDPAMYGPSIPTYYTHETGQTKGDRAKGPLDGKGRRSVYLEVRRNVANPFLEVFDLPKPATTRGERERTNVPAQPLALMNSSFVIDQAGKWAERVCREAAGSDAERIDGMWERALGRKPSEREREHAAGLLRALAADEGAGGEARRVWRDFAQAVFNLKEFVYVR